MKIDKNNIKDFLIEMGYQLTEGKALEWQKNYKKYNNYKIIIKINENDFYKSEIGYGNKIIVHRGTTSNFSQQENFVVLECVNRLLDKGYKPEHIELEKGWRVGGYLDIYVKNNSGVGFVMIECKQWGREYSKALKIILENDYKNEQLLNYYLNDKNVNYLMLYTSTYDENNINYKNDILSTDTFLRCNTQQEAYDKWDKTFFSKGIFEEDISPYDIKFSGIIKKELKKLGKEDIDSKKFPEGTLFNRFAEILRRHTVSDKNNAYNKIFNLFLCKIVDEDSTNENEELLFQWKKNEKSEDVLSRLNDLYKKGMKEYLELDVADVTENELNSELTRLSQGLDETSYTNIKHMFKILRLYKTNEFAFKEVIDEGTFNENAEVVKEVVKLLEQYQIKYTHKEHFLGEFFERLLNIGIKQEAGQFFTPGPITRFISYSIPFSYLIESKIDNKEPDFLPYIIDYACGSGHFLTEAMDVIDKLLQDYEEKNLRTKLQKDNLVGWKRSYKWAKKFIYGIERDYRLSKTTKVACFLNGDGEANIIYGDGLDNFNSSSYRDILHRSDANMDNQVFDVVLANPPYSVENFKYVLKKGKETFELYDYLSDKSDDIECLFVERTKQLLKDGGYAGIIFPNGLLENKGIHQKSREILLKYFEIIGICQLGGKTFAASGQNTSIIFLRKRNDLLYKRAHKLIKEFFSDKNDCSFNGHEQIFSKYVSHVHGDIGLDTYIEKLKSKKFKENEELKLLHFLISYNYSVIVSQSGEKEEEKLFLGFEHSNMKKYEGIHPYPFTKDNKINSMLYNDNDVFDNTKVNSYIFNNYLGNPLPAIPDILKNHLKISYLHELIDFDTNDYQNRIYINNLNNIFESITDYSLVTLSEENVAEILDNMRKPVRKSQRIGGKYPYYGASGKTGSIDNYIFDEKLVLIGEDGARWGEYEDTSYIIEGKTWVNNHAHVIRPNKNVLLHEFLVLIFNRLDFSYLKSRPNGGKLLKSKLITIKFPLPKIDVQKDIVKQVKKGPTKIDYQLFDKLIGL